MVVIQGLATAVTDVEPCTEGYKDNNLNWPCDPLLQ